MGAFLRNFQEGQDAYLLDDYVVYHTGMSALSKIGGEAMQAARRLLIAALLRQSGCVCLGAAELIGESIFPILYMQLPELAHVLTPMPRYSTPFPSHILHK
jgi:hypothetical protein